MRWLKSLVIVLGILIVLGIVSLAFGFYKKSTDPSWKLFSDRSAPVSVASLPQQPKPQKKRTPIEPFATLSLNLPDGCIITNVEPRRRYAYLMIGPTPACNRVILVDLRKGLVLGTIKPQP